MRTDVAHEAGPADPVVSEPSEQSGDDTLAALIAREMHRQGLTLDVLARRSGLAIATIGALRAGTRGKRPRPATLQRIASGLGIPEEEILAAANSSQPLTQTAREAELLCLFRQLGPSDQLLAERILREIVRTTRRVDPVSASSTQLDT